MTILLRNSESHLQNEVSYKKKKRVIGNIFILLSVVEQNIYLQRDTYLLVTDAEKCFEKLWLIDGIFELYRCGTDIRDYVKKVK